MQLHLFCRVIDNWGDIGVCWRLAQDLCQRGHEVTLFVDDASALAWMRPPLYEGEPSLTEGEPSLTGLGGVDIHPWPQGGISPPLTMPDVVIEAFGCELPQSYQAALAQHVAQNHAQPRWINLEYLSAEDYVAKCHLLPSPVMQGAAKGMVKTFFYPGFAGEAGGLLREPELIQRRARFDKRAWLQTLEIEGLATPGEPNKGRLISLFCYEPPALALLLMHLHQSKEPCTLLVTAWRATQAVQAWVQGLAQHDASSLLQIRYLPHLSQEDYDHLLWSCDLNFVRGEDSLVRAIWAGVPFVWQLYPQSDGAHERKLAAFLDVYTQGWRASLRQAVSEYFGVWNATCVEDQAARAIFANALLDGRDNVHTAWRSAASAQSRAWAVHADLTSQLLRYLENFPTIQGRHYG